MIRTSVSKWTPWACSTRACTSWMTLRTSLAEAWPVLTTKPACFVDTWASPQDRPFKPVWSMRSRKISRRPLKGTAGTVHLKGLLAAAAMHEIVHLGWIHPPCRCAGQFDFDDEFLRLLESTLAIRKAEVRCFIGTDAALAVYDAYPRHNMAHFAS